jgi:hypothetical protein
VKFPGLSLRSKSEMLKSLRTTLALLATTVALAAPSSAQESAAPQSANPRESPWAMRAPAAIPEGAPTLSAEQRAAKAAAEKGTPEQQALAHKVADAMYSKDYAAIKQLFAPSTLTCIGKNGDFLQERIKKQFALPINRKFNLKITKLPEHIMGPSKYSTYPMTATHLMSMDFTADDGKDAAINLPIGQEAGKWYEVQPCPTEAGMVRFAKLQQMQLEAHERAKAAVTQVKDPVKSQLLALIGKHDSVSAWKLCMSSMHYDFPTCHGVVSILAGDTDY